MPNLPSLAAALLALAIAAPACGGSDCEKAYETAKKCSKGDKDIPKDKFVAECEAAMKDPEKKEQAEAQLACLKEDSCEKAEACRKAQRTKRRAKEVAEAVAAGKWKEAFDDCTFDDCTLSEDYFADEGFKTECNKVFANLGKLTGDDLSTVMFRCKSGEKIKKVAPDFEKACKTLAGGQLEAAQKAAIAARDAGKNEYKVCSDLKRASEAAGGDAVPAAQKLCDEISTSESAKKAIEEARRTVAEKKTLIPYECGSAADKLVKLDTEWSKKTLDEVYRACFVELGKVVIEEKSKDAKTRCPFEIKRLVEAVEKRDLATKLPELAEVMKKLPATCQK
jgi:hypothetical protein